LNVLATEALAAADEIRSSQCWLNLAGMDILEQAELPLNRLPDGGPAQALSGIPVSVKDLMDVRGQPTTCGSKFFGPAGIPASEDAVYVQLWRDRGARLVGKTHLNEFAYGITGENPWFGDCTLPGHPDRLTGGSSSGAAASVVGGAACVGLGTDTGGSLRVPAALCGLVSFHSRDWFRDHRGVFPLAKSYDSLGWVNRHLGDLRFLANQIGPLPPAPPAVEAGPMTVGFLEGNLLTGCNDAVLSGLTAFREFVRTTGLQVASQTTLGWETAFDTFAPLQAREAWEVHRSRLERSPEGYSPAVRARLEWGGRITDDQQAILQMNARSLVAQMEVAFGPGDILILPATPFTQLKTGADHEVTRPRLLRLTAPASLGCWPVLTIPWRPAGENTGIAFQCLARRGHEGRLIDLADHLSARGYVV